METASAKSKGKGLRSSISPASMAAPTRKRLPHAPFPAYPRRLKLSDLSELSELSRLSKEAGKPAQPAEPADPKPSTVRLSGTGTAEAPIEIPESPEPPSTIRSNSGWETMGDTSDPDFSLTEMQFPAGTEITEENEEYSETTASPRELSSSSSTPTLADTPTHRVELRQLPKSSETPAPLTSSLARPSTATRTIPTKGVILDSNTEHTYIYHHEVSAIISQSPVNKDSNQEEIILLVEVGGGLVAKTNTANTIVICKSRIEIHRLGCSVDNDRWIALVHPRVGKIWLFRIPHVKLLIGGRRPAPKCGICERVIPEGKVAHGCVYTRDALGDGDGTEPVLASVKKVRFALT